MWLNPRLAIFSNLILINLWIHHTDGAEALIRIPKGSKLSLFDMYDLQDVECGNKTGDYAFRSGKVDTFRDKDCKEKKLHIKFLNAQTEINKEVTLHDEPPTIHLDIFLKRPINSIMGSSSDDLDTLRLVINDGNFEFILAQGNITSEGYAAVYNSRDDEERPRFFFVKSTSAFQLENIQSLEGELECWEHAFDEFETLELHLEYSDSCAEATADRYYPTCEEAIEEELCDCECAFFDKIRHWEYFNMVDNRTEKEKKEELETANEENKEKLSVNKTTLSSGKRRKISAPDERQSAANIGILGTVMLSFIVGSLIMCDLLSAKRHIRSIRNNCGK